MSLPRLDEQLRAIVDPVAPVRLDDLPGRVVAHRRRVRQRKVAAVMSALAVAALGAFVLGQQITSPRQTVTTSATPTTKSPTLDTCGQPQGLPTCVRTPEQAAPLIGFAPLLPAYLPDGWVLPPVGDVRQIVFSPGSASGTYTTQLGPQDVMEQTPDGRFRLTDGWRGILMAQRLITSTMRDYCGEQAGDYPDTPPVLPTPLTLENGMGGCVADITSPIAGVPESHIYWFRRDGIEIFLIATSVPNAEIIRIAESLQ